MTYVIVDAPVFPLVVARTSPAAYLRLHGRNAETWHKRTGSTAERFDYLYSKEELQEVAGTLRGLEADGAETVYAMFNNNGRSTVNEEVARRRGIPLHGLGLPGHFVVAHFGEDPPLVYDPFAGGERIELEAPPELVRAWRPQETALRILNNLVASFGKHGDLMKAIRAAELRL